MILAHFFVRDTYYGSPSSTSLSPVPGGEGRGEGLFSPDRKKAAPHPNPLP